MRHSTVQPVAAKAQKPEKPTPDFPLFPHATGRWAKKVRGKLHYFGPWDDPDAALEKWLDQKEYLLAGRKPPVDGASGKLTVDELVQRYLAAKKSLIDRGERSARYFNDLMYTAKRIVKVFGRGAVVEYLTPDDFRRLADEMAKTLGVVARRTEITKTRSFFKWAADSGLIEKPIRFGPDFQGPSEKTLRQHRQESRKQHGLRMFQPAEVRALLARVKPELRAMILLGLNCGYGNYDCASLSLAHLDLDRGWAEFPRSKTAIERRCPLWKETVEALREVLARRPEPRNNKHAGLVFLTRRGRQPYIRLTKGGNSTDHIGCCLDVHLEGLGIKRRGLSFYALRHTFETIGGETKDQAAVDALMGHVDGTMAGVYREQITDERLKAVTDCVHNWLFAIADDDEDEGDESADVAADESADEAVEEPAEDDQTQEDDAPHILRMRA